MAKYIDKSTLVAEIERKISQLESKYKELSNLEMWITAKEIEHIINGLKVALSIVNTLEVKEVDSNNGIQLTWEDIRELYIIFAEVDVDIELCKTADIQAETIGYYQEVLKRFKSQKGE